MKLELITTVRSCAVMIDCSCDNLIFQLFYHFLFAISKDHVKSIHDYMRATMITIIDECDVIFEPLIDFILAIYKQEMVISTAAYKLVSSVINQCDKLKHFLVKEKDEGKYPISRNELRKQNLCFSCKGPWELNHKCIDEKMAREDGTSKKENEEQIASSEN